MTRMEEEADELGADGIVGVRLDVNLHAWGQNVIEFLAIGTAIKHADGQQGWRAPNNKPFQSDLSGQDFWTLIRAGYRPLGFVMGNCVYHIAAQGMPWGQQQNMELQGYTQALYDSRELAMERMQAEAGARRRGHRRRAGGRDQPHLGLQRHRVQRRRHRRYGHLEGPQDPRPVPRPQRQRLSGGEPPCRSDRRTSTSWTACGACRPAVCPRAPRSAWPTRRAIVTSRAT